MTVLTFSNAGRAAIPCHNLAQDLYQDYDSNDEELPPPPSLTDPGDTSSNEELAPQTAAFKTKYVRDDIIAPIRPVAKPPKGRKRKNVFLDDRGFPDQSHDFDTLLHNVDGGAVLRKRRHPARPLDDIDPAFNIQFDDALHGKQFSEDFKPSPILTDTQNQQLATLLKKYWCVFDETGLFIPVKDYECVIDTGATTPISIKGINYGPRETPIMLLKGSQLQVCK